MRGVSHRFGSNLALDGVSLAVPRGAFVVLLGPNGAGKSTLFALVTRLYDNVSGEIHILGHDLRRHPTAALQQLGVVFQSRSLDGDLTLLQNLTYHAALHGIGRRWATAWRSRRSRRSASPNALGTKCGCCPAVRRGASRSRARSCTVRRASSWTRQRSASMSARARVCVAMVRGLAKEQGVGVLWATHLVDEVAEDDKIAVLHQGRVRFAGPVPELLEVAEAKTVRSAFLHLTGNAQAEAA